MVKKKKEPTDSKEEEELEDDEAMPFDEVLRRVLSAPKQGKTAQNAGKVDKAGKT